jgi:hypothetical protein
MLDLVERGYEAVSGPDAVAGHRVQQRLLAEDVIRERAIKVGLSNADVRLRPYRRSVQHARFMNRRPLLGRIYCCAKLIQSGLGWLRSQFCPIATERFVAKMIALEKMVYHLQLLRTAAQMREYRIIRVPGDDK